MHKYLIYNALIIDEGKKFLGNILIEKDKIQQIIKGDINPKSYPDYKIIDATNKIVMPGVIDSHVHFREPGLTHKGDIYTESRAALKGGTTTFIDMPNTLPPTTTIKLLEEKIKIAQNKSAINFLFYLAATRENYKNLQHIDNEYLAGIKIFYGSSTGNLLLNDRQILNYLFKNQRHIYVIHSEEENIIRKQIKKYKNKEQLPYDIHFRIRTPEAAITATKTLLEIAQKYNTKIHFLHISTEKEIQMLKNEPIDNKTITAETTVNHLWFDKEDHKKLNNLIKVNPSLKEKKDKKAIQKAIKTNKIDTIATDHAPHLLSEKKQDYFQAPSGIPSIQYSLLMLLELSKNNIIPIEIIPIKTANNPAKIFNIEKRGFLRENYYADIVIINPNKKTIVNKNNILYKCKWSPLEGYKFSHYIEYVFVNGKIKIDKGKFI